MNSLHIHRHARDGNQTVKIIGMALFSSTAIALALTSQAIAQSDYLHADEEIGTVEQVYDGALTPDLAVSTFRNIDRLFPSRTISASGTASDLPDAPDQINPAEVFVMVGETRRDLYDVLAMNSVTGLIVIHDGEVVYETYQRGNTPETRWMSMSVAKSIASTLVGAAIHDGYIESLESQVIDYVPALEGTAYDGVTVRDVLMMSSGVQWNETYTDPNSDRRALLQAQIAQEPGGTLEVMGALPRAAEPGTVNNYSTGETQMLGEILHGALGGPLSDYLSEKIWGPYGMQADATWWLDSPDGIEIAGSGIGATLRDYARFGQFMLDDGVIDGERILPEGWVDEATSPTTLRNGETLDYGYSWWMAQTDRSREERAFRGTGIHGQGLYVNPTHNIVIAMTSALSKPTGAAPIGTGPLYDALVDAALDLQ